MLIDTHCHLDFPDFAPERDAVVARAKAAGIGRLITISTRVDHFRDYAAIAEAYADVFCTVGTHPHHAHLEPEASAAQIVELASHPKCVGIGEVGLDYHYDHSPREVQREAFRRFVAVARAAKKPLVIHTRAAPDDTLAVLRDEGARDVGGVIHCFSEDAAFAKAAMDLGFDISFSGIVTFKKSDELRAAAKTVPLDRLLIETDAPYLAPMPMRGKRNEPSYLARTAAHLADTLGLAERELRQRTTENAIRRFGLDRFAR